MRLFTAIPLPHGIIDVIYKIPDGLKRYADISIPVKENLHITLRFFGETSEAKLITQALEEVEFAPFSVKLTEPFFLMRGSAPSVFAAGVVSPGLLELRQKTDRSLKAVAGINPEKRKYRPHVTLARVKRVRDYNSLPEVTGSFCFPSLVFTARQVVLLKSTLTRNGAVYKEIASTGCI